MLRRLFLVCKDPVHQVRCTESKGFVTSFHFVSLCRDVFFSELCRSGRWLSPVKTIDEYSGGWSLDKLFILSKCPLARLNDDTGASGHLTSEPWALAPRWGAPMPCWSPPVGAERSRVTGGLRRLPRPTQPGSGENWDPGRGCSRGSSREL